VLASADQHRTGIASGVNNAVARTAGLLFVAALPFVAGFDPAATPGPSVLIDALHRTVVVAAVLCLAGAALSFVFIARNALSQTVVTQGVPADEGRPTFHCGVSGPPLAVTTEQ
jgi:hypothetical protein